MNSVLTFLFAMTSTSLAALPTVQARLGGKLITLEVADTNETRQQGLMHRRPDSLPPDHGMLFVFDRSQSLSFWMKNTFLPLAIGFFDEKCQLVDVQEMAPAKSEMETPRETYVSAAPAILALEMNKSWFALNGVKVGHAKLDVLKAPQHRGIRCLAKK